MKRLFISALFAAGAAGTVFTASPCLAADHTEAPAVMGAQQSVFDITDVYAFRSLDSSSNLTVAMGIFSPVAAADSVPPLFADASRGRYSFFIDTDNDFVEDVEIVVEFQTASDGSQTYTVQGIPGSGTLSGEVTLGSEASVSTDGSARAFAGNRDDHFYFDFEAFGNFISDPFIPAQGLRGPDDGEPVNFFASFNAATIVVDFPITSLPGIDSADSGTLNVWAATYRRNGNES